MAHRIIFNVSAREFNMPDCVKLSAGNNYEDTILQGREYNGETQTTIQITNLCNSSFTIDSMVLFSERDSGGNFEARINGFSIGANQTIQVPLLYFGICRSPHSVKDYLIQINQSSVNFRLNIRQPQTMHPPTIGNVEVVLDNRENYTLRISDFMQKYADVDGHELSSIIIEGDVSRFRLNGQPITSPAEISAYDIRSEALIHIAEDTDREIETIVTLKVRDASGEVSVI